MTTGSSQQNTTKNRYSDEDLQEFYTLVTDKLKNARLKLQSYMQQLAELSDNPDTKSRGLDDSVGVVEFERMHELANTERKYIQNLEYALVRIENKSYGICRETGNLIDKNRLRIVPHATLSMLAKADPRHQIQPRR